MKKILTAFLIDDDQDDQEFFALAVSRLKIPVKCEFANDCKEALEMLSWESFKPDFIFLDINMPLINGIECLREIRKINRFKQIPVYMHSTSIDDNTINDCIKLGANGVIKKAYTIQEIKQKLEEVIFQQVVKI